VFTADLQILVRKFLEAFFEIKLLCFKANQNKISENDLFFYFVAEALWLTEIHSCLSAV
jgi:hypothetical protein